ncbi:putative sphingomyelinase [Tieghemostelium lacteum]|uniref:sphingomyelin phosphodiesterase n=1 Tax=Tieghemostelium lacteum TaxID=361077 RepID=A0A151ZG24_TIELA|nr:putative sphingomyelinase [Tieghemostelium lacteum]|eukprot:KYQ92877.1 putative sphingomyelinase [Tieghemostelium lacteum]
MQNTVNVGESNVRLLTYNLFIRPPGIRNNKDDYKDERIECLINDRLAPKVLKKVESDNEGVPNSRYRIDLSKFPNVPFLSPWRTPYHHHNSKKHMNGMDQFHQDSRFEDTPTSSILGAFDIVCFQELFSAFSYRQRRLIEKAKTLGFSYSATSPLPPYFKSTFLVDGGLVVISRYPIVDSSYLMFTQGVDSDMLASKGVLYCKIKLPNHQLIHLFTTHLQASYINPNALTDTNVRNDGVRTVQLNQLREFILEKTYQDAHPIILAGDLNVDARVAKDNGKSDSPAYLEMLDILSKPNPKYTKDCVLEKLSLNTDGLLYSIHDSLKSDIGVHPPTVGDIYYKKDSMDRLNKLPRETELTNKNDYMCMKRLDYILFFDRQFTYNNSLPSTSIIYKQNSTKVEPFFIDGFPFTQLSDHYGVSTILQTSESSK